MNWEDEPAFGVVGVYGKYPEPPASYGLDAGLDREYVWDKLSDGGLEGVLEYSGCCMLGSVGAVLDELAAGRPAKPPGCRTFGTAEPLW